MHPDRLRAFFMDPNAPTASADGHELFGQRQTKYIIYTMDFCCFPGVSENKMSGELLVPKAASASVSAQRSTHTPSHLRCAAIVCGDMGTGVFPV